MATGVQDREEVLLSPFLSDAFRADLALLVASGREASRRFADDAVLLARLAAQVPRVHGDERGGTAWTSFLREVAVARAGSDRAAAADVALATRLVAHLPRALSLLQAGVLPVLRARALVESTYGCTDRTVARIDAEVSERACRLAPSRIRDAVHKVLLREEADAVAARAAAAAAVRQVRRTPLADDRAEIALTGPAVPLEQAFAALDADARALRAAGDGRGLDALRFDLATSRLRGDHPPGTSVAAPPHQGGATATAADTTSAAAHAAACAADADAGARADAGAAAGAARASTGCTCPACGCTGPTQGPARLVPPPDAGSPDWLTDRRCSRPVRMNVTVPVTTALGLSNEPGWLDGHGWISAPTCRQLLPVAELRQVCADARTGRLVDLADHVVRPALDPAAVSAALLDMAARPFDITDTAWQQQPQHDPGDRLTEFVVLRDQLCDGPNGTRVSARHADLDHDRPHPNGPTAAWNLVARSRRTHALKHRGWQPVRTLTSTLWFSPAGQLVEVPFHAEPLEPLDHDAQVPDPVALHALDAELLRPPTPDDSPPDW